MQNYPKYLRCECGRLLTDNLIRLGICAGHKQRYATQGNLFEWLLIKLKVWEKVTLWRTKREIKRLGY